MSIKIQIGGIEKKFNSPLEAISFLSSTQTEGFPASDYRDMVKTIKKSNPKSWKSISPEKLSALIS
ncbi:MAG: hypothetical protein LBS76_00915 [Mycoplasmataceae bacterium]|nr:hypothetical protein [Mycoplasmataceae bacterium]